MIFPQLKDYFYKFNQYNLYCINHVGKRFRHEKNRERNEAFLIITQKTYINYQFDTRAFKFFDVKFTKDADLKYVLF